MRTPKPILVIYPTLDAARKVSQIKLVRMIKPRMGRPPRLGDRATITNIRLSRKLVKAIKAAAKKANRRQSEWMRDVLYRAALAELQG